jgi:hypothetical protein
MKKSPAEKVIDAVNKFQAKTGLSDTTIGREAIEDSTVIPGLRAGTRRMFPETADKLMTWLRNPDNLKMRGRKRR